VDAGRESIALYLNIPSTERVFHDLYIVIVSLEQKVQSQYLQHLLPFKNRNNQAAIRHSCQSAVHMYMLTF
jgi:hypothetical protein